jgi:RND superfamily putative drug exporter
MDYEVLLLTRIQEAYREQADNVLAVSTGLQRSGPIITGAAAIMVGVFGSFASGHVVLVKALGLGLALAVAADATIVRVAAVPALMRLLGRWNWWTPWPHGTARASERREAPDPTQAAAGP